MPVMRTEIANRFKNFISSDIQRIPVLINGTDGFEILNCLTVVDAINEDKSSLKKIDSNDDAFKRGQRYSYIVDLVINSMNVTGLRIFRLRNWELPLIVNEEFKNAIVRGEVTGLGFTKIEAV